MFVRSGSDRELGLSKHLLVEAAVIACLSTAIAAAVFAVGTWAISPPSASLSGELTHPGCRQTALTAPAGSGIAGVARLCLDGDRISLTVEAENLTVGNTYTAWLTYLDPERPWTEESLRDLVDPRPAGLAGRIDGQVAKARNASFSVDLHGLSPGARSEFVVSLFGRGPLGAADERSRALQLQLSRALDASSPTLSAIPAGQSGPLLASARFLLSPLAPPTPASAIVDPPRRSSLDAGARATSSAPVA
jgi:hypothetical protein